MPIVPCDGRALHLFGETSKGGQSSFEAIPIKRTLGLLLRVYIKYWSAFFLIAGLVVGIFSTHSWLTEYNEEPYLKFVVAGWTMLALSILSYLLLWFTDNRNRRIRRVLGYHQFGNSDPATWTEAILSQIPPSTKLFGTENFSSAVPLLLEKNDYPNAMWVARLSLALEDRATAEQLTSDVLTASRKKA